jgi:hypothetical protein
MAIFNLYSKRKKKERGEAPDVFTYDDLPHPLRVQIVHILRDAIGSPFAEYSISRDVYAKIVGTLCREYGVFQLARGTQPEEVLANFVIDEEDVERVLGAIEVFFHVLLSAYEQGSSYGGSYGTLERVRLSPAQAINDLNTRFLEAGIGYQYVSGEIIRKDSEFLHAEVIKPALALIQGSTYRGANDEFLKAHEQYRKGDAKGCLAECLKSLESTLKTICKKRRWPLKPTDTAKTLLETCFNNGLVPQFLQSYYSALRTTLESGVPTIRNKLGGHGQGAQVVEVPQHYAAYMLHMTGSAICFLVEAEKTLP